jgi:hypothetical protein
MGFYLKLIAVTTTVLLTTGCKAKEPPKSEYELTASVRDIMSAMVMPSASVLWNAVSTNITAKGIEEKAPQTEEEWYVVRNSAVTIAEACNLILMPGRRVAAPGEKEQDPNVNLTPERIEAMISSDPAAWIKMTTDLHDSILPALKAIDAKDAKALSDAGVGIDKACETCHLKYWYPKDAARSR